MIGERLRCTLGQRAHRNPRNLFILNLALSGLLTSTLSLPPTLTTCLTGGRWFLGLTACKLVPTLQGRPSQLYILTSSILMLY